MNLVADLREARERLAEPSKLRLLFFDIETAPMLAYIWQQRTEFVGIHQITHETFMLSWAAKWADRTKVEHQVLTSAEAKDQDDTRIVKGLADLLRSADIIVGHNLDRFDVPMLNNRLMLNGLEPLGPVKTLDTLKLAKRTLRLASNKLDWLAQQLGVGAKIETDFDLWKRCYLGEAKALAEMVRYNRHDVVILQQVYELLEPHARGVPRLIEPGDNRAVCPTCGSDQLKPTTPHRTNASTFPQWRCLSCHRTSRSRRADRTLRLDLVPTG